ERLLELPEGRLGQPLALADQSLRGGDRERSIGGDAFGDVERDLDGVARFGEARDETTRMGVLGGDGFAGERHLHGDAVGPAALEAKQCTAGGEEPNFDLRDAETSAARRHEQVAGERDLETAGDGEALDRCDQRFAAAVLEEWREPFGYATGGKGLQVHP